MWQSEVATDFKLKLLSLENFLIWKSWKENRYIQKMYKGFQIFLCVPGASGMLGALQVFSRQCSCSTTELILQLSLLQEFFHVNFSSFSSTEKHSQSTSLKTLEHLNISVKQKAPVSNNTLLQTVISVYVTLTCISILRKPFMVILLIFPGGREHTSSSAFRNCFKLGRINGPSYIVLQVGKAPLKGALTLFSDFYSCSSEFVSLSLDDETTFSFSSFSLSLSFPFMS